MQVGLALPQYDYVRPQQWAAVVERAAHAERLGFDSLWLADHLFMDIAKYGGPAGERFGFDPIVALGALARTTSTIALGTLVLCAQLRPPELLMRQLDALRTLSGDRIVPGVGAGWNEPEYVRARIRFERPWVRLGQMGDLLDLLGAWNFPRLAGGKGDRFLEVVAAKADVWNTAWIWTPEVYAERAAALDRACEQVGRDPATVERSLALFTLVGEDQRDLERRYRRLQEETLPGVAEMSLEEWKAGRLVGTVEEVRAQLARWRTLGVSVFIAGTGALPFTGTDPDDLDLVASALL